MRASRLLDDAMAGARLSAALPAFFRRPLTAAAARAMLRQRLKGRAADFLVLSRLTIYRQPRSPMLRLLRHVGCEYGDLEQLISREGLEGGLRELFRLGVYLTIEEFKGRRPLVRGSLRMMIDSRLLANPYAAHHLPSESGGSRGGRTSIRNDIRRVRDASLGRAVYFEAVGGFEWQHAIWEVPGSLPIFNALKFAVVGALPVRSFLHFDPAAPGLHPRYRWSNEAFRLGCLLAGVRMPRAEPVLLSNPQPIAAWMHDVLRAGQIPHLYASTSAAVRVCETALGLGLDLQGARFMLASEPATPSRQAAIRRIGAEPTPTYGAMEVGGIGEACASRRQQDGMHLLHDLHAVIQPGEAASGRAGLAPKSLLFTPLRRRVSFCVLNLSLGDQAELEASDCGCALQEAGWAYQVHSVRSFEKLTAGGMSVLDVDLIRVLEAELPGRFGGGPLDYQLLEDVDGDGRAALRLLVHPRIGPLDETAVRDAFLAAIGGGDGASRVLELQWREGEVVKVEREAPRLTPAGKVLHLHQERSSPN